MANTGVKGKVVDQGSGTGLPGLIISAYDVEVHTHAVLLGSTKTSTNGDFSISYSKWAYGLERKPDLIIRVYDSVLRLLYESPEYPDVTATTFTVPTIQLQKVDYDGWLVTLLKGSVQMLRLGNSVTFDIDNKVAWEHITNAVKTAVSTVNTTQLIFDVNRLFTIFNPSSPPIGSATTGARLEESLLNANKNSNVAVRILLNEIDVIPGLDYILNKIYHSEVETKKYYNNAQNHTVKVRSLKTSYNNAMHSKCFVIDDKVAYLNISPLLQEYFDDVQHKICDPRRGEMYAINVIKVPVHDVSAVVEGPSVVDLNKTFALIWRASGGTIADPPTVNPSAGQNACAVQVTRTLPADRFKIGTSAVPAVPDGELGILESYLRAIKNAEHFIYIENQYITEPHISTALCLALCKNTKLQLIILGNNAVDAPRYHGLQKTFFTALQKVFPTRVGVFTLWSHEYSGGKHKVIRNYVHSKVAVVDDKWVTIGSANLDGQGLVLSQHVALYYSKGDIRQERAVELNITVFNNIDGQPANDIPGELRRRLWSEHLGLSVNDTKLSFSPSADFLKVWNDAATAKLSGLKSASPTRHDSRILKWNEKADPDDYLHALGVPKANLKTLNVMDEVDDFDFSKGKWKGDMCP